MKHQCLGRAVLGPLLVVLAAAATVGTAGADVSAAKAKVRFDTSATLRLAQNNAPGQWDPHRGRAPGQDYQQYGPVYDRLLQLRPDLSIAPMLATHWDLGADGLSLSLRLRKGVQFHDGTTFDAQAVKTNLDRARGLTASIPSTELKIVTSVDVVGPYEVNIKTSSNASLLPAIFASSANSSSMISPKALEMPATLATKPVGTGPYTMTATTQAQIVYERTGTYWDASARKRLPQRIEMNTISDANARLNALTTDQVDAIFVDPTLFQAAADAAAGGRIKTADYLNAGNKVAIQLNIKSPSLSNPDVRRALNLAINRRGITTSVTSPGACAPSLQPFAKGSLGYVSQIDQKIAKSYNPQKARRLLSKAGATDLTISVAVPVTTIYQNVATAFQAQLAEIGVRANLITVPGSTIRADWQAGKFDTFVGGTTGYADSQLWIEAYVAGPDSPGGVPAGATAILDRVRNSFLDAQRRTESLEAMTRYLADEPLQIFVCTLNPRLAYNPKVVGVDQMAYPRFNNNWEPLSLGVRRS